MGVQSVPSPGTAYQARFTGRRSCTRCGDRRRHGHRPLRDHRCARAIGRNCRMGASASSRGHRDRAERDLPITSIRLAPQDLNSAASRSGRDRRAERDRESSRFIAARRAAAGDQHRQRQPADGQHADRPRCHVGNETILATGRRRPGTSRSRTSRPLARSVSTSSAASARARSSAVIPWATKDASLFAKMVGNWGAD